MLMKEALRDPSSISGSSSGSGSSCSRGISSSSSSRISSNSSTDKDPRLVRIILVTQLSLQLLKNKQKTGKVMLIAALLSQIDEDDLQK